MKFGVSAAQEKSNNGSCFPFSATLNQPTTGQPGSSAPHATSSTSSTFGIAPSQSAQNIKREDLSQSGMAFGGGNGVFGFGGALSSPTPTGTGRSQNVSNTFSSFGQNASTGTGLFGSNSNTSSASTTQTFGFNHDTTPAKKPVVFGSAKNTTSTTTGLFAKSNNVVSNPNLLAASPTKPDNLATSVSDSQGDLLDDVYHCINCGGSAAIPLTAFICLSCNNFYHKSCYHVNGASILAPDLIVYHDLQVCRNCHFRLENSGSAAFHISRPFTFITNDTRPLPRRSSRKPDRTSEPGIPDSVAIIAEHFNTLTAFHAGHPFHGANADAVIDSTDELPLEPLFEIGDSVIVLVDSDEDHIFQTKNLIVVDRYWNSKGSIDDDDAADEEEAGELDEGDTYSDELMTIDNSTSSETTLDNFQERSIDDLLGKGGWYYKVLPSLEARAGQPTTLWHEESLELGLDDDSDDDDEEDDDENHDNAATREEIDGDPIELDDSNTKTPNTTAE